MKITGIKYVFSVIKKSSNCDDMTRELSSVNAEFEWLDTSRIKVFTDVGWKIFLFKSKELLV